MVHQVVATRKMFQLQEGILYYLCVFLELKPILKTPFVTPHETHPFKIFHPEMSSLRESRN